MTTQSTAVTFPFPAAPRLLARGLQRLRRRVRLLLALRLASCAVGIFTGAAVLTVVFLRLRAIWFPALLPEAAPAAGIVLAGLAALLWPLPDALLAASADRRLQLRDRLATARQLLRSADPTGMEQAQVQDALAYVEQLRVREAYPARLTRAAKLALAALVALALAQLLPIPPLLLSAREKEDRAFLKEQAAKIEPVAKDLAEKAKDAKDTETGQLAENLQKLAQDFRRGDLSKKQALMKLDDMNQKLEKNAQRLAPPPPKTAARAAEELRRESQRNLSEQAERLAEKAAQAGRKEEAEKLRKLAAQAKIAQTPEELKKLAEQLKKQSAKLALSAQTMAELTQALANQDLDKLSQALKALEELPEGMTPEELAALSKQLESLAKSLSDSDLKELAKQIKEAAKCSGKGQCKSSQAALAAARKAAEAMAKRVNLAGACRHAGGTCSGLGIGPGDSKGKYDPKAPSAGIYAPREMKTNPSLSRVPGQIQPGGKMLTTTETGAPDKQQASKVPYYEVIEQYSKSAEEALSKEEVPPGYKDAVRDYFHKLQSNGAQPTEGK